VLQTRSVIGKNNPLLPPNLRMEQTLMLSGKELVERVKKESRVKKKSIIDINVEIPFTQA
jgi:hypothetical protein